MHGGVVLHRLIDPPHNLLRRLLPHAQQLRIRLFSRSRNNSPPLANIKKLRNHQFQNPSIRPRPILFSPTLLQRRSRIPLYTPLLPRDSFESSEQFILVRVDRADLDEAIRSFRGMLHNPKHGFSNSFKRGAGEVFAALIIDDGMVGAWVEAHERESLQSLLNHDASRQLFLPKQSSLGQSSSVRTYPIDRIPTRNTRPTETPLPPSLFRQLLRKIPTLLPHRMNRPKLLKTPWLRTPSKIIDDKTLDARIVRRLNESSLQMHACWAHDADDGVLATEGIGEGRYYVLRAKNGNRGRVDGS